MDILGGRRKLLAKTLMDISKITVAATFASEFFLKFTLFIKLTIYVFLVSNIMIAFFVHPKGED